MSVEVTRELADVTILDLEGNSVILRSLWEESDALLVFVRHYG